MELLLYLKHYSFSLYSLKNLRVLIWGGLCVVMGITVLYSQDSRERRYLYPILEPNHQKKPQVNAWAQERISEKLNRGLVAVLTKENAVYISWRLLQTDPAKVGFNLYKSINGQRKRKINPTVIYNTTGFVDKNIEHGQKYEYSVSTVVNGKESEFSGIFSYMADTVSDKPLKIIKFQGDYMPDRIAIADLNGDGEYDFIIKQPVGQVDPGVWRKSPTTFKLEAYLNDGTFLWQMDLGVNIELGIWYSPFIAYDFNGDGKAEIAIKTAPDSIDYRREDGRVFNGPEYCSILDGMTGKEIHRVNWPERTARFGDYNRNNRNQLGMAYLDGKTPCLLVARGTYRAMVVDAYELNGRKLNLLWRWDGDEENPVVRSQGAHSMHTVDVDNDGRDEIVLGSAVVDDNGCLLYSVGVGHSDKCFVTDIDPERPGMEIFYANEVWHDSLGVCMVDAATGSIIWKIGKRTQHVGEGMVADIDPNIPGLECFAGEAGKADPDKQNYNGKAPKYMFTAKGEAFGDYDDVPGFGDWIFWDADLLREEIIGGGWRSEHKSKITKYKGSNLFEFNGRAKMVADIYGDWREELISVVPGELHIYSTPIPANDRRVCLMQDPLYRSDIVHRSMGYEQPPVTSYFLGVKTK